LKQERCFKKKKVEKLEKKVRNWTMNVLFLKRRSGIEALMFFLKKGH